MVRSTRMQAVRRSITNRTRAIVTISPNNQERLHSALAYITPADKFAGLEEARQ